METTNFIILLWLLMLLPIANSAQNFQIDVNPNIKHFVGGISDFGRERHITNHEGKIDYNTNINQY